MAFAYARIDRANNRPGESAIDLICFIGFFGSEIPEGSPLQGPFVLDVTGVQFSSSATQILNSVADAIRAKAVEEGFTVGNGDILFTEVLRV